MPEPKIDFWFDFASTYSWLAAIRIDALTRSAGCAVGWKPFLLGPIFKAQGWATSPFNLYPAKGRYMVRDLARIAETRGRRCVMPKPFPANSVAAARMALAIGDAHIAAFARNVFEAQFECGADISRGEVLAAIVQSVARNPVAIAQQAGTIEMKEALRQNTATAQALGIFGAPTFITCDGELFWGDDRLEQAIDWAVAHSRN